MNCLSYARARALSANEDVFATEQAKGLVKRMRRDSTLH
jgi:hypothetical protein